MDMCGDARTIKVQSFEEYERHYYPHLKREKSGKLEGPASYGALIAQNLLIGLEQGLSKAKFKGRD